jgi:hypothetical protein
MMPLKNGGVHPIIRADLREKPRGALNFGIEWQLSDLPKGS